MIWSLRARLRGDVIFKTKLRNTIGLINHASKLRGFDTVGAELEADSVSLISFVLLREEGGEAPKPGATAQACTPAIMDSQGSGCPLSSPGIVRTVRRLARVE